MTPTTLSKPKGKDTDLDARVGTGRGTPDGRISVKRKDDYVVLTWVCGATRRFTLEDAEFALKNMEAVAPYEDVVFADADSDGAKFWARVIGNRFYAQDTANLSGSRHVPWLAFRKAWLQAIGTKEAKEEANNPPPEPISEEDWRSENE